MRTTLFLFRVYRGLCYTENMTLHKGGDPKVILSMLQPVSLYFAKSQGRPADDP